MYFRHHKASKVILSYWLPVFIYCLLIFLQSSYPSPEAVPRVPYIDKFLHFLGYAILGILFFRAYSTLSIKNRVHLLIIISILSSALYGIGDELHQYFVPCRDAEVMDALADLLGSIGGVTVYFLSGLHRFF